MHTHKPKGKLISIGGAEDKGTDAEPNFTQKNNLNFFELQILQRIVQETGGTEKHIEVITTASSIPEEVGDGYLRAFGKLGCNNVQLMHIKNREHTANPEFIERIQKADGIMMTGGNQLRLSTIIGGTNIHKIMSNRYMEENLVIAGTSAGAMAMSNTMIYQGSSSEALLKGEVKLTTGLGLLRDVIIDTHFVKRGRFGRLAEAVASNPSCIGIGLGEDTGLLISEGTVMEAVGSGLVIIIDGHNIMFTNIADVQYGSPISIENLAVHVLAKGNCFDLHTRKFFADVEEVK
ncbi:MAG: cyanophycinase [Bacteroidetes bacterium]|nr:cyanophycinase [Bacteroidota bacterium]